MNGQTRPQNSLQAPLPLERWSGAVILLTFPLCAGAFSFRMSSFLHAKEVVLIASLLTLSLLGLKVERPLLPSVSAYGPLWLFLLYSSGCVSLGIAQSTGFAFVELNRLGILLLIAAYGYPLMAQPVWRERFMNAIVLSSVVVALLGIVQYLNWVPSLFPIYPDYDQQVYSVFGNQDLFGGYIALGLGLSIGPCARRTRRSPYFCAAVSILLPALLISASRSAWLAAVVGALAGLPYRQMDQKRCTVLTFLCAVIATATCMAAPQATTGRIASSFGESDVGWRARLWIWDAAARMIADRPILGRGLGNFRYWSPYYHGEALWAEGGESHYHNELHTLHAHSDPLEALADTGLVGMALLCWMLVRIMRCRGREWGGLAALLVFSLFNATFQSAPHSLAALFLLGGLVAATEDHPPRYAPPHTHPARLNYILAPVCIVLSCILCILSLLPSYYLRAAGLAREEGRPYESLYARAVKYSGYSPAAAEEFAFLQYERGEMAKALESVSDAHRRSDTGSIHYLLGLLALERGDRAVAKEAFEACRWRWPSNYGAWEGLLQVSPPSERESLRNEAARWLTARQLAALFQ